MNDKPKLLVIGHGCTPTGYSRVMHSLIPHWIENFEVHHFTVNNREENSDFPWTIHPNSDPFDMHGYNTLEPLLRSLKPELILVSNNFWYLPLIGPKLQQWSPESKVAFYFPVEGDRVRPSEVKSLVHADLAVTFTQFGVDTCRNHPEAPQLDHLVHLPHGVDADCFYPLATTEGQPDREFSKVLARESLFPFLPKDPTAFIVLNSNRHQESKRIDLTLQGFQRFAKDKPANVLLCLNMSRYEDHQQDLQVQIRELGLENRVLISRENPDDDSFSLKQLNTLYNACDVGVNTSMGEGWGLVAFEHAATGNPQIVPGHSACRELWQGFGEVLDPPTGPSVYQAANSNTAIDPDSLAAALERLYSNRGYYDEMANKAWSISTKPEYAWKAIAQRWSAEFLRLLQQEPVSE